MKKRKKNLRQILIPAFIITACIPLAIFALISQERLKTSTLENMNNQAEADLQKANQSLNMTLDKYETLLYAITTDEEFLSLVVNANDSEEIPEADAYNMRRDFSHICNRNEGVDGIQLVLSDKRRIFYDRLSSSSVNSTWMEKVKIPDETKLLSYDVDKDTDNPERMFHIGRKVVNYWDISEDLGYVILSVNLDELESVLSAGKGSRVYLVKDGVIVGAEDTKMLGRQEKALDSAKVNQKAIKNARSGWSILLCQSIREYQKAIEEQVIFWIMVALAVLLIFVLLIYRVTKPVMISVNDIVDAMKNLEKDNFREKLEVKEKDSTEIQEISEGFNEMSERIHNLIGQVKESAMEQKNAEISALEAQIDPHFLYNTLEGIRSEAIMAGLDNLADMTEALAIFFRYTISKVENLVTVEEELENCATYFKIQQYRFGSRIHLEIEQDEEDWDDILHCMIPKLTLQPILENSIIHGIELKLDEGKVTISISRTKSRLLIKVSDDGVGMNRETLDKLNAKLGSKEEEVKNYTQPEKGGVALVNVNNRIHLIFGEEYGMHVYSLENMGTSVELSIPVIYNENELKKKDK